MYLTRMGSVAYGVSTDQSDVDIYGVCIPPKSYIFPEDYIDGFDNKDQNFEVWQKHGIEDKSRRCKFDFQIYNIVHYFKLAMDNNPNMVDSLFVRREHIMHITQIFELVRENRKLFLHKGIVKKMKGYAYSQLNKAKNCVAYVQDIREYEKQNGIPHTITYKEVLENNFPEEYLSLWRDGLNKTKRFESQKIHNMDCFEKSSTEFLTDSGWKYFDEINNNDKLGTCDIKSGKFEFQFPIGSIIKKYCGSLYNIQGVGHSCNITSNHNMLVSRAERSKRGYKYLENEAEWELKPLCEILLSNRSWYHIRTNVINNKEDYDVSDEYLIIAGLYLSEGTIIFKNNKVLTGNFVQTDKGKLNEIKNLIKNIKNLKEYSYYKSEQKITEYKWNFGIELANKIYKDFGHKKNKRLPKWVLKLSKRQAELLWYCWFLGDGSRTTGNNGEVIYSTVKQAVSDLQALMTIVGINTVLRGPYKYNTSFGSGTIYQLYKPDIQNNESCVGFGRRGGNYPIQESIVNNVDVVCFEMPNSTLITRHNGKISIQGNCKFLYHVYRLVDQAEYILNHHDLDLQEKSRVEKMKAVRRGDLTYEQIVKEFSETEVRLDGLYNTSTLRMYPDKKTIRNILLQCLEHHYGSLSNLVNTEDISKSAIKEIKEILNRHNL